MIVTSAVVVDASAVAAVLFDEPEAAAIVASITGPLLAPALLRYEIASVCLTKGLREPGRVAEIEARHALLVELDIEWLEPDWRALPQLARRWGLSTYDAAYLSIALGREAGLVTLDARLAAAYDSATAAR